MRKLGMLCALLLVLCALGARAEEAALTLPLSDPAGYTVQVRATTLSKKSWLFLPAFADVQALLPQARETEREGVWQANLADGTSVNVMRSENLRAVFLFSDDPQNAGRAFVDGGEKHSTRATGVVALVSADGHLDYAGRLRQIRGRGNGTWLLEKKPYQIKLEERADLLQTGDPSERGRTWVLLAEMTDPSFLHNHLAYNLGLELGMQGATHSEHVDLYYDGEYRGLYLLAEKPEIGKGRIEQRDYEKLIEAWNEQVGQYDLESLPEGTGVNRYGNEYHYVQGVADSGLIDAGAYMLEMETILGADYSTLSNRCWFRMDDGSVIALKSPENASEPMVRYISEALTEARRTLKNGGVNPETGQTLEEAFDVDAFARLVLINELAYNLDGFRWSSTFFILPAVGTRFVPGPPWDFDLAWSYRISNRNALGIGLKDKEGWLADFYGCPAFLEAMERVYEQELYPLVQNVLLGGERGRYLSPLEDTVRWIAAARRMEDRRWYSAKDPRLVSGGDFEGEVELLRRFVTERSAWLRRALAERDDGYETVECAFDVIYGHPQNGLRMSTTPWGPLEPVSCESQNIRPATEEDYGVWQVEAVLSPREGRALTRAPVLMVNGVAVPSELMEDGTVRCAFTFEDLSYRPVEYLGEDLGLVFNYDTYVARYPEVLDICGDDPEAVLEYFCDEGMYEGQMANDFFSPEQVLIYNPGLKYTLGEEWQNYYWDLLYYGYDEGWLLTMGKTFRPVVSHM